jgi:hypothetical protein
MLEIVDPDWETRHGHAHASARYGSLSWASPAEPVSPPPPPVRSLATIDELRRLRRPRGLDRGRYSFDT